MVTNKRIRHICLALNLLVVAICAASLLWFSFFAADRAARVFVPLGAAISLMARLIWNRYRRGEK